MQNTTPTFYVRYGTFRSTMSNLYVSFFFQRASIRIIHNNEKDLQGNILWPDLLRPICNYSMNLIRVPVGNYMGPRSSGAKVTSLAFNSIATLVCNKQRGSIEHLGKLLVYSIRPAGPSPAYPALGPLEAVRTFAKLLEHFYQVPNAGGCVLERAFICMYICAHFALHFQQLCRRARSDTVSTLESTNLGRCMCDHKCPLAECDHPSLQVE